MRRLAALTIAVAVACAAGCSVQPDLRTRPVALAFPDRMVPSTLDGLQVELEPSAAQAFGRIGPDSAVARGQVWTLRQSSLVVGSVQVSQLKGGLTTAAERVRAGIREAINNGSYRWFKVLRRQWVGLQSQPQVLIYLWMPATRPDVYVVMQVKPTVANPDRIVTDLIAYEEGAK